MTDCICIGSIFVEIDDLESCFYFQVNFLHEKSQINSVAFLLSRVHFDVEVMSLVIDILESSLCNGKKNGNLFPMCTPVYIQI